MSLAFVGTPRSNLTINGAQVRQTIDGMGVNINVNSWSGGQLKPALDQLISTNGSSLFRVIRDPLDWVGSESQISALHALEPTVLREVYEAPKMQDIWNTIGYLNQKGIRGQQILLNFMGWTPAWLGGSGAYGSASYITAGKEPAFATMVASLVYYGKVVKRLDFSAVSSMNEQDLDCLEGPCVSAAQYTTILRNLADELAFMNVTTVRLVGPDTASLRPDYIAAMMADPIVASQTDHLVFHTYSGPALPGISYPGKNYWLTETSAWCSACDAGGSGPGNEWAFAKRTIDFLLGDLNNGIAAALLWEGYDSYWYHHDASSWWGLIGDDPPGVYTPRKRFFATAQINRFVNPGDVVIESTHSIQGLGTTVAVHNANTGKIALIGRNSASKAVTINGQINDLPSVSSLAMYVTNATANLIRMADISVSHGAFTAVVPPDSIFSLTSQTVTFDTSPPSAFITVPASGSAASGTLMPLVGRAQDVPDNTCYKPDNAVN